MTNEQLIQWEQEVKNGQKLDASICLRLIGTVRNQMDLVGKLQKVTDDQAAYIQTLEHELAVANEKVKGLTLTTAAAVNLGQLAVEAGSQAAKRSTRRKAK